MIDTEKCEKDEASEANKQVVADFYRAAFVDKDFDAALGHLAEGYVQHNPLIADGAAGLRARLEQLHGAFPALTIEIRRLIAEGDYVAAHVHAVRDPAGPGTAIMDFFRLADGRLAEHWDVLQDVPAQAANRNGMF
jgi:predicted SnoaL-like aldol condensation-catalyzing enzyme